MGSFDEITGNPFTPFTINYKYDKPDRAFRSDTKKCNESYADSAPCACVDCHESCPVDNTAPKDDSFWQILNKVMSICLIVILFALSALVVGLRFRG